MPIARKRSASSIAAALGALSLTLSLLLFLLIEPNVHLGQTGINGLHFARGLFLGLALAAFIASLFLRRRKPSCCN